MTHFHELACRFGEDSLEHVGGELSVCHASWCDDLACDVAMCVDAGQYCFLCDGAYLGSAASIARWAIFGCGCGFEDAEIGYLLRATKLFKRSGGRDIGQDGSSVRLGGWWAGGERGGHPWRVHSGLHPWRWCWYRSWGYPWRGGRNLLGLLWDGLWCNDMGVRVIVVV